MRKLILSTILCLSIFGAQAQEHFFDPHFDDNNENQIELKLDCDASMSFIKVYTSNDLAKLKDKKFQAGHNQDSKSLSEGTRTNFVQGSFKDEKGFYYLLSKYELTEGQAQAILEPEKCKKFNKKALLPKTKISYFEAMDLARSLTLKLNSTNSLFKDNTQAYVRLPTDEEWEFAARGGLNVTATDFMDDLPLIKPEEVGKYIWSSGSQSSNNKLQLIGLKKPNPLGFYDMLGNAKEMMLEPFKLVRTQRLLGISGGMSVRGGSFRTPLNDISCASRQEIPYYVKKGESLKENSSDDLGVRLVIANSVLTNLNEVKDIKEQLNSLNYAEDNPDELSKTTSKLDKIIEKQEKKLKDFSNLNESLEKDKEQLQSSNSSLESKNQRLEKNVDKLKKTNNELNEDIKELNSQLIELNDQIKLANVKREEFLEESIASNLRLGGFLCRSIRTENATVKLYENFLKIFKNQCDTDDSQCAAFEKQEKRVHAHKEQLKAMLTLYGDSLNDASSNFKAKKIKSQIKNAKTAFGKDSGFDSFVDTYARHLENYPKLEKNTEKNFKKWISDCIEAEVKK